jgi:DNA transposition AAA+ family ATPase
MLVQCHRRRPHRIRSALRERRIPRVCFCVSIELSRHALTSRSSVCAHVCFTTRRCITYSKESLGKTLTGLRDCLSDLVDAAHMLALWSFVPSVAEKTKHVLHGIVSTQRSNCTFMGFIPIVLRARHVP